MTYATTILATAGLVSYWRLGESTGATASDSKGTNHLTINGATLAAGGAILGDTDTAFSFDGADDYLAVGTPIITQVDDWTVELWVRPPVVSQRGMFFENGTDDGFALGHTAPDAVGQTMHALFGGVAWLNSGYTFPVANEWYYIVISRSAGITRFYVNGVQTPNTHTNTPNTPAGRFTIGCRSSSDGLAQYDPYTGRIDEVAVYNVALTLAQIQEHYAWGAGQKLRPGADTTVTGWQTNTGATTNLYAAIDDIARDDADYIQTDGTTGTKVYEFPWTDPPYGVATDNRSWTVVYGKDVAGGTVNFVFEVYESGVLKDSFTRNNVAAGWVRETLSLTGSYSNWNNVTGRITATVS